MGAPRCWGTRAAFAVGECQMSMTDPLTPSPTLLEAAIARFLADLVYLNRAPTQSKLTIYY